jgi:hypothetical protein
LAPAGQIRCRIMHAQSPWDVPTSMRNVDAECRLEISLAYNQQDAFDAEAGA